MFITNFCVAKLKTTDLMHWISLDLMNFVRITVYSLLDSKGSTNDQ